VLQSGACVEVLSSIQNSKELYIGIIQCSICRFKMETVNEFSDSLCL